MSRSKKIVEELLSKADVRINGPRPWDIQVHNESFYNRVFSQGSLGLGESYMDEWWDCDRLDEFINKILVAGINKRLPLSLGLVLDYLFARISNQQTKRKSKKVAKVHYDLGNDLYERMLDKRLVYSCGYWAGATDLDQAQADKLDLVCRKLGLKPGMKILDIGCGFGGFMKFAAEKYGITGVGITISEEQAKLARKLCAGLPVEIRLQDYRDVDEKFDAVASLGMFEHVGYKNYGHYMEIVYNCLPEHGLFLLQTIGRAEPVSGPPDPWINRYIFPGGMLPTISSIGRSIAKKLVMEDWHSFGPDYDKTLTAWMDNFRQHWPEIASKYGKRFYRMWEFYLLSCAGSFRARNMELWQIVLSKNGVIGGYKSLR